MIIKIFEKLYAEIRMRLQKNHLYIFTHIDKHYVSNLNCDVFYKVYKKPTYITPHVGRVAQRKKKFNDFYCLIMI